MLFPLSVRLCMFREKKKKQGSYLEFFRLSIRPTSLSLEMRKKILSIALSLNFLVF